MNQNIEKVLTLLDRKGITLDEARAQLGLESQEHKEVQAKQEVKARSRKSLRIYVKSEDGDVVKVSIPVPLAKLALNLKSDVINSKIEKHNIDLDMIMDMIDSGEIGELVNIESSDGDIVKITID